MNQRSTVELSSRLTRGEVPQRRGSNRMRVAQIAPLAECVPPKLYGGTERVVSWLADELVALGHEVTLFASGDSRTKAKLVPAWPRALRLGRPRADPAAAYATLLEAVAGAAAGFDVIHSHVDWLPLPLLRRLRTPFLNTLHGRLDLPDVSLAMQTFGDAPFISISQSQRAPLPGLHWLATIHHGMPSDCHCALPPRCRAGKIAISTRRSSRSSMTTMSGSLAR